MKIYDCFTFWNENDMVKARIEFFYPFVDKFVIVESDTQHDGSKKGFYLDKENLKEYWDKIIYIQDTNAPALNGNTWAVENHHRNCINRGLIDAQPEDIILVSDLDEWPDPQHFEFLKSNRFQHGNAFGFQCHFYNYFLNILAPLNPCVGTVAVRKSTLDMYSPQHMRNIKDRIPRLMGGWHMSWLGGVQHIWEKFMTSCDVSDKNEIPPADQVKERLKKRLKEGQFNLRHNVDLPVFFVENPTLPSNLTKEKYPQFFLTSIDSI